MNRYIDLDVALDLIEESRNYNPHKNPEIKANHDYEHDHIRFLLTWAVPKIEVAPVVHGKWKLIKSPWTEGGYILACSNCKQSIASLSGKLNYCPTCGAKMDRKEESKS